MPAKLLPVHDAAGDAERPAQQLLSQRQLALGAHLPQPGAAHPLAVDLDGGCRLDGEALHGPHLQQKIEIAGTVTTEAEIVTDLQIPYAKPLYQRRMDELGSTQLAQASIEREAQHQVHALLSQQAQFFPQAGKPSRGLVRREELTGLRLEDHHAAGQPQFGRALAQARQDGLMPPVHSVEVADGGDAPPMPGPQVVKTSNQLHTALLA